MSTLVACPRAHHEHARGMPMGAQGARSRAHHEHARACPWARSWQAHGRAMSTLGACPWARSRQAYERARGMPMGALEACPWRARGMPMGELVACPWLAHGPPMGAPWPALAHPSQPIGATLARAWPTLTCPCSPVTSFCKTWSIASQGWGAMGAQASPRHAHGRATMGAPCPTLARPSPPMGAPLACAWPTLACPWPPRGLPMWAMARPWPAYERARAPGRLGHALALGHTRGSCHTPEACPMGAPRGTRVVGHRAISLRIRVVLYEVPHLS